MNQKSIFIRLIGIAGLAALLMVVPLVVPPVAQSALLAAPLAAPCDTPANPIVAENCLPGNPSSEWEVNGDWGKAGDSSIQGFATAISVNRGSSINFKIATPATAYRIDIYRMGYYNGSGARKVATIFPSAALPQTQPACLTDAATGLIDCGNWGTSASWSVPASATSGIYFARPTRTDGTPGASHIPFIVRDDSGGSDLLFQTSDTTWQAYNEYGGNSLYVGGPGINPNRAYKVSYNRPFITRAGYRAEDYVFQTEYPMVRWLESNGYDVSYISGIDTDRSGSLLLNHKVFLSVGHDEYWSGQQRANVEAARAAGVNLAFFSGNEVYWRTRWENSIDGSGTPYRTLVSYKETHANAKIDPSPEWTGTWRDPRFTTPHPENALTGQIYTVNCCVYDMTVPSTYSQLRFWRNTSVAALPTGTTATLTSMSLGYEWDETLDNGYQPAGLVRLSSTTQDVTQYLLDYGNTTGPGRATHHLSLYRAASGALVFGAGTIQWSWGLDSTHDNGSPATSPAMQQATVNVLADMGVQPATLQSGLIPASASTDHTAPNTTITRPVSGTTYPLGSPVTVYGTASDAGGGVVAGVEVSTDGGATWHPAVGLNTWKYRWTPAATGTVTLKSRAVDDSANLETSPASVTVTVAATVTPACPCQIWANSTTPLTATATDGRPIEVGVKFRSDVAGYITGLRFYKSAANTGTHVGHLWSGTGTQLAEATFTSESASGWQQVTLSPPVPITANTTYVASYFSPAGYFAKDDNYFDAIGWDTPPLHALADGVDGPNGVYVYDVSQFPTTTSRSSNYYVDIVLSTDMTTPVITWANPANIVYSTALSAIQLNATASVPGTFAYSPPSGTVLNAGLGQTLHVDFLPNDALHYLPTSKNVALDVLKANQTITFTALSDTVYGSAPFTVSASASSGLTVTFTASGTCSISGAQVTVTGAGSCTVTAHQAGDANVNPAAAVPRAFNITRATAVITWSNPADIVYGTALGPTQLNAIASVPGTLAYSPPLDTVLSAGSNQALHVDFTPTDTIDYDPASKDAILNVLQADQTITFDQLPDRLIGDPPFTLSASASSNLLITYSASGNCSIAANVVTLTQAGSCTVTAHQPGNVDYHPAPAVARTFTINRVKVFLASIAKNAP